MPAPAHVQTHITSSPEEAAAVIRAGGLVAFPTETVYGLGANALDASAVARIFEAKERPADNPLIVHISDVHQIELLATDVSGRARQLVEAFFPGPLTVIVPKSDRVPDVVTAGLSTVAVRMPDSKLTQAFLNACGVPVAAPSANRSGRPSPTTWQDVVDDLDRRIECVLQGTQAEHGVESTVVDCTVDPPVILRSGAVTLETLAGVVPEIRLEKHANDLLVRSPGTRHRHYAPDAPVVLVDHPGEIPAGIAKASYIGLDEPLPESMLMHVLVCRTPEQYAFELYRFLRASDQMGVRSIYCQRVEETGLGRAVMDRLRRASDASTDTSGT